MRCRRAGCAIRNKNASEISTMTQKPTWSPRFDDERRIHVGWQRPDTGEAPWMGLLECI